MKIWKPLMCASLLGIACSLPAQAHGPYTDDYSRAEGRVHMSSSSDMWNTGTSRDPHGLPTHGAWGTGSTSREWAATTQEGGYSSRPMATQPSYAPRERRWSDEYQMRGY